VKLAATFSHPDKGQPDKKATLVSITHTHTLSLSLSLSQMQKENEEMRRERERERATMLKGGRGFLLDKKDYSLMHPATCT
jgi:hypothetical protein